jgi:hypothetical protein
MFKLTLRELFLLVTMAAIGVAWWMSHSAQVKRRLAAEGRLRVSESAVELEKLKARVEMTKMSDRCVDYRAACEAHGLYLAGTGKSACLVDRSGQEFTLSNMAEDYRTACEANRLFLDGTGTNARLVEASGKDFKRDF